LAGLDENGLTILRLPEVIEEVETSEQTNIDPNINTQDDELLGQLNTIFSAAIAEQWAIGQAVNDNFNPLKAEGKNLDDVAAIIGITRIGATKSSTDSQEFTGDEGTSIPVETILENPNTTDRFVTTTALILSIASAIAANLNVQSVLDNTTYTVFVNATQYDFLSDGTATEGEILAGLKAAIDADGAATWTADVVGSDLIITTSDTSNIAVSGLVNMVANKATDNTDASAVVTGSISATTNSVVTLISTIAGLDSTTNTSAYVVGRDTETDEEFRIRIITSQQISGRSTVPAIEDAVANVIGVSSTKVFENRTLITDGDGRPGKSFETIVSGGTDTDVSQEIYDSKPAGIETFGTTNSEEVLDSQGETALDSDGAPVLINFTRPSAISLGFRVRYTKYDEETFPADGDTAINNVVVAFTNALGVDVDVIPSRYFGPIYAAVEGINSLTVEVELISSPGFQTTKLPIDFREFASTITANVDVAEV
jgi:uncharacterized phage protein gp47/JayE